MFDKEYSFKGKHAEMVEKLTGTFAISNEDGTQKQKHTLFKRNFDVYLLAPIIGFLYSRKSVVDTELKVNPTKIFAEILMKNSDDLKFNYRLIMLLDKENEPDNEKRIEKAFRGQESKSDEELYDRYVLGGVEVLYEKLIENGTSLQDVTTNLYDFLEEFDGRYNDNIDIESVLELARKSSI